jgi:hypothetical protein
MEPDKHHIKQVCFKLQTECEDKRDELAEAIERLAPKGEVIRVERGKAVWEVVSDGPAQSNYYTGCFRGRTRTGKIHFFHYKQIIIQ